ncbi:DnaA regulatory inactivator Hda [Paraglaciecola marina]|uniref:DnaA regulatory inactivator Hda n=1 Tax=Paraglaciecola marina TaxID=2500157 RepID=UPI00105EBF63|nr:DnaA regulatory inactivator Hda [Paraglaciecola marina]
MGQVTSQLLLPVGLKDTESFESFIPGKNQQVCHHLLNLFEEHTNKNIEHWLTYLFADTGVGKSHLLYASCLQAEYVNVTCVYFSFKEKQQMSPDVLQSLEHYQLICFDDIEYLDGEQDWQEAIFNLINRVKEKGDSCMVITGNQTPQKLTLQLPDLISRLSWGTSFQVHSLTDEQRQEALIVKASHRGLNMSRDVARYLVTHWQRDMPALIQSLDILDEKSLQQQRKLTIPFVKDTLLL